MDKIFIPAHRWTQQICVLPTRNQHYVFTARYMPFSSPAEKMQMLLAYTARKYRYTVSDLFGSSWHEFGRKAYLHNQSKHSDETIHVSSADSMQRTGSSATTIAKARPPSSLKKRIYDIGNRITTRRCDQEYFMRNINLNSQTLEFVYPKGENEQHMNELLRRWIEGKSLKNCQPYDFKDPRTT